jgi:hypothetical protein
MKRKRLLIILSVPILALLGLFLIVILPLPVLIPHQPAALILPFAAADDANVSLIPMGEKIYHPNAPGGHPGIDFGGPDYFDLLAAMDGRVTQVLASGKNAAESKYDVKIEHGPYFLRYFELDSIGPKIIKGQTIAQGDLVGTPHKSIVNPGDPPHTSVHWEFGSTAMLFDRLCPMTYFEATSQQRITAIWEKTPLDAMQGMKRQYPEICSGGFVQKTEPSWMIR